MTIEPVVAPPPKFTALMTGEAGEACDPALSGQMKKLYCSPKGQSQIWVKAEPSGVMVYMAESVPNCGFQ